MVYALINSAIVRYRPVDANAFSNGDDLNNFVTPGMYSCGKSATAKTLLNCPVTIAFKLEVFYNGPGTVDTVYGYQIIHNIGSESFYKRRFRKTADTSGFLFYDWTVFTASPVA